MPSYSRGKDPVDIDLNANTVGNQNGFRTVVSMEDPGAGTDKWVYSFIINSSGHLGYHKSTDNGATFGSFQTIDAAPATYTACSVWFDRWTSDQSPHTTSNIIRIVGGNTTNNGLRYFQIDTNDSDAITGDVVALSSTTINAGSYPSICLSRDSTVYVIATFSSTSSIRMAESTTPTSSWTDRGGISGTASGDRGIIVPLLTDNDVWVVLVDISGTDTLEYAHWDAVGNSFGSTTNIVSSNGIAPASFGVVHDPVTGDVYVFARTILSAAPTTTGEFKTYLYDESAQTIATQGAKFWNPNDGINTGIGGISLCLDTSTNTLIAAVVVGGTAANTNVGVMFSHDLGVSWSDTHRIDGNIGDDYRNPSILNHLIDETLGIHVQWVNDDTNDIHLVSYILDRITGNVVDNSDVAVSGAAVLIFGVDPDNGGHERYYFGRAVSDGSGNWSASAFDVDNDNIEIQMIYDEDLTNDEVDASHRLAVDSF